ncbi:outer envelope protein 80, chloroplastic-like isoform X1 [Gossypium australe]|uniref:Outer envelope protein 80, chloroplastic-like isoform X1 n=1 Tax=Gossypium australe TaxID=47621 RepID=A0A5B6X9N7_9ROSI|nr:outer envelope protein 80, chloroplastic-like isoform X1 [Gossypium australe]
MHRNDGVCFTSSSFKIPLPSPSQTLTSPLSRARHSLFQLLHSLRNRSLPPTTSTHSPLLCCSSLSLTAQTYNLVNAPLLCSASLSLSQPNSPDSTQSGSEVPQKGQSTTAGRYDEERVLISEVLVRNKDGEELERKDLEMEALTALKACRANSALTVREVQEDVHRIIDSGTWRNTILISDLVDIGFLWYKVEPNQEFHGLVCEGANVLPSKFLEDAFRDGHGKVVNLKRLDEVINSINGWYMERGLFGLVSGVDIFSGGIIRLQVAEAEVNNISIRFLDRKTGEPTKGKTKPETILRQLTTKKGQVYSMLQGKRDVDTVSTMGLMADVSIIPQPAGDAGKVDLVMNVVERPSGGFSAGGGISSGITSGPLSGLIGSFAYSHRNLFGRNQKLNISLERGQIDSIFRINYTDPWIEGDDKRTSRTIIIQNSRTPGTLVHGNQHDNSSLSIGRVTAGIEFSRPLRPKWSGTAGLIFQHAGARDEKGNPIIKDFYGSPLTASGKPYDDMLVAKFECVYTGSGDQGSSMFAFNMEQGLPVMPEWLFFNRVNARARKGVEIGPTRLLLSLSGGKVLGNFSPHEAFAIGGTNSVRGYEEGAVGSGRSYVVGSSEVSFPMSHYSDEHVSEQGSVSVQQKSSSTIRLLTAALLGPVEGVIFADYGHDLWSGPSVPGDPAGARYKPGSGYGYGFGIRVDSPLGPLRLEYAFNDRQAKRFHFGVGHRN